MRFRYLYYPLNKGVFINNLKQTNPDLVHIHGLTYQTKPFIDCCEYLNIPYMLTLHGLNGKLNTLHKHECEFEVDMLKKLRKNNINVSVVSSGIKKRIKTDYGIDTNNISVILNGIKSQKTNSYLCNKQDSTFYNIICVGNISIRKNQLQLIRAYKLLPDEIQRKIKICFCGLNINHIPIQNEIQKSKYPENLIYMGFVSRDEMTNLWKNSDLNVVMSIDEGFGLSMIEGFSFGVPTLTFNDIDAVGDIYNEHSMKLIITYLISVIKKRAEYSKIIDKMNHIFKFSRCFRSKIE